MYGNSPKYKNATKTKGRTESSKLQCSAVTWLEWHIVSDAEQLAGVPDTFIIKFLNQYKRAHEADLIDICRIR